jgi:hypothetical protein
MANRYWVGGTGTWDNTSTTNWSTTSGGSSGASVPIETDSVFFDANSNATSYTVYVPNGTSNVPYCLSLSVNGPASGTLTFADCTGGFGVLSVYDSATFAATGVIISVNLSTFCIGGSSGAGTLTTNGATFNGTLYTNFVYKGTGSVRFSTGSVSLGSSLTNSGTIAPQNPNSTGNGLNTNGYAVSCAYFLVYGSVNLSSSTITASGGFGAVGGGTINCGTSLVTLTGAVPSLNSIYSGPGIDFYNVNYTGSGTLTIDNGGNNSFNTLSNSGATTTQTFTFPAGKTQTVGNLALNGAAGRLITLASSTTSAYTITRKTSGTNSCSYCSVSYMTGTSTAVGGGTVGWKFSYSTNGGNNTNLVFTNAYYWVGGSGTWDNTSNTHWSLTSGGAGAQGPPTSADDVVFDTNSNATAYTVTMGTGAVCYNMNMSGPTTGQVTWAGSTAMSIYGSMTLSGTAANGGVNATYASGTLTFAGVSSGLTIATNGVNLLCNITFNGSGATWTLLNNTTSGSSGVNRAFVHNTGTINFNNFSWSHIGGFQSNSGLSRGYSFGTTGAFNFSPGITNNSFNMSSFTGVTVTGTSSVNINPNGLSMNGWISNPTAAQALNVNYSGSGSMSINLGTAGYNNLTFTGFTGTYNGSVAHEIFGNLTFSSGMTFTSAGANWTFDGTGTQTVTTNGITIDFPIIASSSGSFTIAGALTSSSTYTCSGTKATDFGYTTATFSSVTLGSSGFLSIGTVGLVLTGSGTCFSDTVSRSSIISYTNSAISATSASAKTMSFLNGNAYVNIKQAGAGALTLTTSTGTGTINLNSADITNTVSPATILITGGLTVDGLKSLNLNGTSGNLVTLGSTNTTPVTLRSYDKGIQTSTYCYVSYITGSNTSTLGGTGVLWRFLNSTNVVGNTNLTFASKYYWVGGSGTWDESTTTNWSLTSGGSGGAGVPTAADDVIFNSASNATSYTISSSGSPACFNVNASGPASGTVTFPIVFPDLYGSCTLSATGIDPISYFTMRPAYPATLTSNGTYIVNFSNVGTAIVSLGSALTISSGYGQSNTGAGLDTKGYNVTVSQYVQIDSGTILTLNGSTFTLTDNSSSVGFNVNSGATINAGSSTLNIGGFGGNGPFPIYLGGKTWYNVVLNYSNSSNITFNILDTGTNTFNTFTYNGASAAPSFNQLVLSGNITCTTLNLNNGSAAATNRLFVRSDTIVTSRSIAGASSYLTPNYCDFRDISATNTNFTFNNATVGNCGGNGGALTFVAGKTVYWNGLTGGSWTDNEWATSSGGSVAAANFPLAQDTAILDNTGLNVGQVINIEYVNIGSINASGLTKAITLNYGITNTSSFVGNLSLSSSVTLTGSTGAIIIFYGPAAQTISASGATISNICFSIYNSLKLLSALTTTTSYWNSFAHYVGTLDLNGYTLTTPFFYSSGTGTRAIALNSGSMTVTGLDYSTYYAFDCSTTTNLTVTGTATISMTNGSTKTFQGGSKSWGNLVQGGAGTMIVTGSNIFTNISNSVQPTTISFTADTTQTVTSFGVKGTAGNLMTLNSTTPGTRFTISQASGKNILSYLSIQDSNVTGGAKFFAGTTSTNVSNNLGWIFANPANPLSINSAGILSTPNVFDETQTLSSDGKPVAERTTLLSYQISGILDETQPLTYNGKTVAKRIDKNGNLYVSGYLDEVTPQ